MDNVLRQVGACGRFQVIQVTLVQSCRFAAAMALPLMMFGLYNPGWRCMPRNATTGTMSQHPYSDASTTISTQLFNKNVSMTTPYPRSTPQPWIPDFFDQQVIFSKDEAYQNSSFNKTYGLYQDSCDIIDSCPVIKFNPASDTIVTQFALVCDKVWIGYVIVSLLNCGMVLGAFLWGYVGERFGRKVSLYGGHLTMTISSSLAILSPVWEVYALFTFFIGFGIVGVVPTVNVLSMEYLDCKWRARVSSVPVFNGGFICFAVAIYVLRNWKYVHLTVAFVCGISCLGCFWTPESVRWLVLHGKKSKAEKTVARISRVNKKNVPRETVKLLVDTTMDSSDIHQKHYTYLDLFRAHDIRYLTIRLCMLWSFSICTYEIIGFGIQSLPGNFYINIMIASVVELPGMLFVGLLANHIGRRKTGILFSSVGVFCCFTVVVLLLAMDKNEIRDILVTSVTLFNRLTICAIISLMIAFGAELIPTAVRNLAFSFFNLVTRLTGIVGSFIIPRDHLSLVICFAVLMVLQAVSTGVIYSLSETKGKSLKETIKPVGKDVDRVDEL